MLNIASIPPSSSLSSFHTPFHVVHGFMVIGTLRVSHVLKVIPVTRLTRSKSLMSSWSSLSPFYRIPGQSILHGHAEHPSHRSRRCNSNLLCHYCCVAHSSSFSSQLVSTRKRKPAKTKPGAKATTKRRKHTCSHRPRQPSLRPASPLPETLLEGETVLLCNVSASVDSTLQQPPPAIRGTMSRLF